VLPVGSWVGSVELADLGALPSFVYSSGWDTSRLQGTSPSRVIEES